MSTASARFSLGVTYRPRRAGFEWWQDLDRVALQDEFAQIADLGFTTIRLALTWEAFQPSRQRIGSRAMNTLEQVLDAATNASLQAALVLFPVGVDGLLGMPDWANGASLIDELSGVGGIGPALPVPPIGGIPVYTNRSYQANQARDLFSYRPVLAAQRFLIDEVVGYFASHPAILLWQIGEGFERAHRPAASTLVQQWYRNTADAIRTRHARAHVLGATSIRGLGAGAGPRPDQIIASCDMLGVSAEPPELPGEPRRHTSYATFLHTLTVGLAGMPAIVTAVGMPTTEQRGGVWANEQVYGRSQTLFYADLEQQAGFVEAGLDRLYRAGAAGVWLAAFADHHPELWRLPPLDRYPRLRTLGLIDAQGQEKPATAAVRAFARRLREAGGDRVTQQPAAIDAERYWHNPARMLAEFWAEFEQPE